MTAEAKVGREVRCPYCGNAAAKGSSPWGTKYECVPCDARVGCHTGTDKPLGTLANAELRAARMLAHGAFDVLWKELGMKRVKAYAWLGRQLGVNKHRCHIAMFTVEECREVVRVCNARVHQLSTSRGIDATH